MSYYLNYCRTLNFRGTKLSRIEGLDVFAALNFREFLSHEQYTFVVVICGLLEVKISTISNFNQS